MRDKTCSVSLDAAADTVVLVPMLAKEALFSRYGVLIHGEVGKKKRYIPDVFSGNHVQLDYQVSINRLVPCLGTRIDVDTMEQHPHSSQVFLPLVPGDYLTVVGLQDAAGRLEINTVQAFILPRLSGIAYHPGTWHYAFTALQEGGEVAVILGHHSNVENTEYIRPARGLVVDLAQYRRKADE